MRIAALLVCAVVAVPAFLQAQASSSSQPITQSLRANWEGASKNIKESADVMPEATYHFKPIDSVRTFGQILAHVAGANYVFCAAAKGEKAPHAEDEFEKSATTRAAIIKAVGDSLAYCDAAFAAATDTSLAEMVDQPFGGGKGPRVAALIGNIGHLNEHYGNLVTYFRIKGIVPPSSRR